MVLVKELRLLLNNLPGDWDIEIDKITIRLNSINIMADNVWDDGDASTGTDTSKRFIPNTVGMD
jgi:hypothetical protein